MTENLQDKQIVAKDSYQNLTNATIMIVDDETTTMDVVQTYLEDVGYRDFVQVEDSTRAMKVLEETNPGILLLDLLMPIVSGFEILAAIRQHPRYKRLPVIILTSLTDPENKLKALDLGATDFLTKPVDPSELGLRVRNTLAAKAYLDQLVYYDPLTSLPNRQMFLEHFALELKKAKRYKEQLALMNIELDYFDRINDTMGLAAGDEVLRLIAERIQTGVRDVDFLCRSTSEGDKVMDLFRIEGSVFSLLLYRINSSDSAALVAERLIKSIREPLQVQGEDVYVKASIGISVYPSEGDTCDKLLRLASSAKDYIKNRGGDSFQFYSNDINELYENRRSIESKLRQALEYDQFSLHYQPQVDFETGVIKGVEALLRWDSADMSVSPDELVPVAEETGLIVPIGEWVLNKAFAQLAEWHKEDRVPISMSVNLSAKQFRDKDFFNIVKRTIDNSSIDPKYLTLEITESLLLDDIENKSKLLQRFKDMGLKLAIDDFGTGYASMTYLSKLPVDELKIDRSFILNLPGDKYCSAIVSTIIYLSESLGLRTVAEGVETREQFQYLQDINCDLYQGFLFSKPLKTHEMLKVIPIKPL